MNEELKQKLINHFIEGITDPGKYWQHDDYISIIEKEFDELLK